MSGHAVAGGMHFEDAFSVILKAHGCQKAHLVIIKHPQENQSGRNIWLRNQATLGLNLHRESGAFIHSDFGICLGRKIIHVETVAFIHCQQGSSPRPTPMPLMVLACRPARAGGGAPPVGPHRSSLLSAHELPLLPPHTLIPGALTQCQSISS